MIIILFYSNNHNITSFNDHTITSLLYSYLPLLFFIFTYYIKYFYLLIYDYKVIFISISTFYQFILIK